MIDVKKVDVVILSNCKDDTYYQLNLNCITSLQRSEPHVNFNIVIVESDVNYGPKASYDNFNVEIITPKESFNFNRFLNFGIAAGHNDLVILANNDLIFHEGWLDAIIQIKKRKPEIKSFCPFDRKSPYLDWGAFNLKEFILGYRVPIEFVGWCIVIERSVLKEIGPLDETFDLYFQDNDLACTLRKKKILHAMVPNSFVEHLGGQTTGIVDASNTRKYQEGKANYERKWPNQHTLIMRLWYNKIKPLLQVLRRKFI